MRIGVGIPFMRDRHVPLDAAELGRRARWIESAGLDGIWMGDASFRRMATWPDPLLWLAVAAAATEHVEVGTCVYQVPLREPVDLAQRLMTLEALTKGRATIGVGAGSTPADFAAVGADFERRFKDFHKDMATIRALLRGETVGDANLEPWESVRPGPRFVLGAWSSDFSLRKAVADFDGWMCSAGRTSLKTMADGLRRYRDLGGRRAMISTVTLDLRARTKVLGEDDPFTLCCEPTAAAERLAIVADLGFDDILVNIRDSTNPRIFDGDLTLEELEEARSLLPADPRPRWGASA